MVKKNDAPTEIETITLTMSRPVAEAVQAACEWYLRLHMGQFWDLAEDLCFAKFYSDAENKCTTDQDDRVKLVDKLVEDLLAYGRMHNWIAMKG